VSCGKFKSEENCPFTCHWEEDICKRDICAIYTNQYDCHNVIQDCRWIHMDNSDICSSCLGFDEQTCKDIEFCEWKISYSRCQTRPCISLERYECESRSDECNWKSNECYKKEKISNLSIETDEEKISNFSYNWEERNYYYKNWYYDSKWEDKKYHSDTGDTKSPSDSNKEDSFTGSNNEEEPNVNKMKLDLDELFNQLTI